jgi:hypothetical protein
MIIFVPEASRTCGGEELHENNRKMVPIISESTKEERKARAPPLKKKSWKSIRSLIMAGRTSGIKTVADSFSELRIMQINTCWKDNSKYFPMTMALFSGTEYTGCGNQIKSTVISVDFQIEPF